MKQQSITTLPPSPEAERRSRMIKYTIAMTIRVACVFAMLFAKGWWLAVFAAGAIFLPYVAVVLANVSGPSRNSEVLRPGGLVPTAPPADRAGTEGEDWDVPPAEPDPAPRFDAGRGSGADADAGARHPDAASTAPPTDERGAA
jgi:Protein of unknown function (DUF3099)